ncbi:hypothetical protein BDK51DRAFT_34956, partial [Blyttiomyces helicus]
KDEADVGLLNSCTVKGPSEQHFANDIQKGKDAGKKVVVAGEEGLLEVGIRVPFASLDAASLSSTHLVYFLPPYSAPPRPKVQQIDQVVSVVEETLKGNTVRLLREAKDVAEDGKKRKAGGARLDLPKIRRNPFIEIIPINTGCLNQCTYCKAAPPPEEIIARVEAVLDEGVKEIWLTSEDTGAYGHDIGVTIVTLLQGIVAAMDRHPSRDSMLRIGMTNPPYILSLLDGIAEILNHPRVYAFLHVPVQAGSDKVLDDMRRLYTAADFRCVVDTLRENVPGVTIATDVIAGFPTESEEDFEQTMVLLREYRFSVLHISQFYPRPGTPAARLQRLPTEVVKARSRLATRFFESYQTNTDALGSTLRVLVTERGADGKHFVGHDKGYRQVLVPMNERALGRKVDVRIVRVGKHFLEAEFVEGTLDAAAAVDVEVLRRRVPRLVKVRNGTLVDRSGEGVGDGAEMSFGSAEVRGVVSPEGEPEADADEDGEEEGGRWGGAARRVGFAAGLAALGLGLAAAPRLRWSVKAAVWMAVAWVGWETLVIFGPRRRIH